MSQMRTHSLEERKREERVGELQSVACHKRGLTRWRGGRGRSGLVSFEAWHVTNEDSPTGGKEEGGTGGGYGKSGKPEGRSNLLEGRRRKGRVGRKREERVGEI